MARKVLFTIIYFCLTCLNVQASNKRAFEIPRSEVIAIKDHDTGRTYELYIKLPANYSNKKQYPAVYMTDAMYTFQIVSGATRYPINAGYMEDIILVGISWQVGMRANLSRQRDYTPTVDLNWKSVTGEADKHLTFLQKQVFGYIEQHYSADPMRRTYIGNSLGGLFGAYVLLTQPETFHNYILGSPSFWYDNNIIFRMESESAKKHVDIRANVFLAIGERETPALTHTKHDMVALTEKFYNRLINRNYRHLSLQLLVIPSANHETAFPTTAIQGLWWLFAKK